MSKFKLTAQQWIWGFFSLNMYMYEKCAFYDGIIYSGLSDR